MIEFARRGLVFLFQFIRQFNADQVPFLAAGLCYFITFSIFPLLLVLTALIGFFMTSEDASRHTLQLVREVFPHQSNLVADTLAKVSLHHQEASLLGLITLLWSGKNVFGALASALNSIWKVSPRPWLIENLRASAAALSIGVAVLIVSLAGTIIKAWSTWGAAHIAPEWAIYPPAALQQAAAVGPVLIATATLTMLYRWLPNCQTPWHHCLGSAAVIACTWDAVRRLFGWYLQHVAALDAIYGSLGGALGFMLWIYVSAILVLAGAEISKAIQSQAQ